MYGDLSEAFVSPAELSSSRQAEGWGVLRLHMPGYDKALLLNNPLASRQKRDGCFLVLGVGVPVP